LAVLAWVPFVFSSPTTHTTSALIVTGGLVTSVLLNLFLLPALYARYAHTPYWKQILMASR